MSKKEDLEPDLNQLFTIIDESGEEGIHLGDILKKLGKDGHDSDVVLALQDDLYELSERGYIHREIIQKRFERGVLTEIKWFAAGKGKSVSNGVFMGMTPG